MERNLRKLMFGILAGLFLISCNDGADAPQEIDRWYEEVAIIDSELTASGTSAEKDPETGVAMVITKLGTGLPAQLNHTVDVDYVGRRFEDKVQFDAGNTKLKLSDYIPGWRTALSKLPSGSEAKIIIPSLFGYGSTGSGNTIPPNTILEFDVKFNKASRSSAEVQRLASDIEAIDEYLSNKSIEAVEDTTGIRYVITAPGIGPTATWFDRITLKYTIKLLSDDTRAIVTLERAPTESYYSRPVDYIHGMLIGLQKFSVGTKATIYVPSPLGFGTVEVSDGTTGASVPANSNIIVDVEVIDID